MWKLTQTRTLVVAITECTEVTCSTQSLFSLLVVVPRLWGVQAHII